MTHRQTTVTEPVGLTLQTPSGSARAALHSAETAVMQA
jgi:hypothetical protein